MFQPYLLNDYFIYYVGAVLYRLGLSPYAITHEFIAVKEALSLNFHWSTGYSYPPPSLLLFAPFSFLPPIISGVIWTLLSLILYCLYISLTTKNKPTVSRVIFFLTFLPGLGSLFVGQVNFLVLLLLYFYLTSQGELKRGIFLALAPIFKPNLLLLLLPDLLSKKYWTILSALLLFPLLHLPFPKLSLEYYFSVLPRLQLEPVTFFHFQSFHAFLSRLFITDPISPFFRLFDLVVPLLFAFYSLTKSSAKTRYLIWLTFLSLFAGLNSFANLLLLLPVTLFLLKKIPSTNQPQRYLLYSSIAITNGLFVVSFFAERLFVSTNLLTSLLYAILSSLGFFAALIQYYLLTLRYPTI